MNCNPQVPLPTQYEAKMSESLALKDAPTLRFRQLHQDLVAFMGQSMTEDDAPQFMAQLVAAAPDLLQPLSLAPPNASERAALQANTVNVCGKHVDVSSVIQQEICTLSDEFRASEKTCFEFWLLASDQEQREWVERADQLPPRTISDSVKSAARYFLTSEMEYKLHLLKELLRLRLETGLDKHRAEFIVSFTNKLMTEDLVTNLINAFDTHLVQLAQVHRMEQSVSYWHTLVADCLVYIVSSTLMLAEEVRKLADLLKTLSGRLKTVVAKVSPHIVNFSSFAQLFEGGSLAGTSPEGAVRQVSCMLQTITALQVALFVVLLQRGRKMHRETGDMETGVALCRREDAPVVKELHRIFYEDEWEQKNFQSVAMLAWAGFLARNDDSSNSSNTVTFAEAEATTHVVRKAIEERVFNTLVDVQLKYWPDKKRELQLYKIYQASFELLFRIYSSKMMIDVPTLADKAALAAIQSESDGDEVAWTGDCLENIIDFATALCARSPKFCWSFWRNEQAHSSNSSDSGDDLRQLETHFTTMDGGNCHDFLIACRDAALKNPGCLAAYLRLVASAASGAECAQQAFHHVKQNPQQLSWDHFFAVMAKYQRLLTEAEKPAGMSPLMPGGVTQGVGIDGSAFNTMNNASTPGPRFIRPKELEALETIQQLIQEVIAHPQLALIFFHNHNWSPIPTFVAFLQCRIPSSLKGSIMKTLAAFARIPDIAPYVWRQVDALQILRTTGDPIYGNQDISYELEHYESLSRTYPATRGFVTLLYELFENPHAWKSFEGDGRVAAIQYYFEFLLEHVFLKFDLRKYEREEEKWALVNGTLSIFKKILRNTDTSTTEGSLSYQLLARFLSSSPMLNKVLSILSEDGGVENLENTSTDMHLEHAFFYCLDIVKRETEAKHGSLNFVLDVSKKPSDIYLTKTTAVAVLRERSVQHALEIVVLVLEKDVQFVNTDLNRQLSHRVQVELMHTILCRHRSDFVNIVKYIKYSKSVQIPHLSVVIMRRISARMRGTDLVNLLIDSGASADLMIGYMNRLLNVYEDEESDAGPDEAGTNDNENHAGTELNASRKLEDRESFARQTSSIRVAILDLLLENLDKSAPNLAHLILGSVNQHGDSSALASYMKTGLAAVLSLVSTAEFGVETPELAERCYHVLHKLITQEFSSSSTLSALETGSTDFFGAQLQLFSRVYHITKRNPAAATIATLNMRGWFFKTLALYLHICLHKEPPPMKKVHKVMGQLLATSAEHSVDDRRMDQMLLIQFLAHCSFDISPPKVPTNQQVVALAEQVTVTVSTGCYYKWLEIDIERFCQALEPLELTTREESIGEYYASSSKKFRLNGDGGSSPAVAAERWLQWAVQWNIYSERIAAESHALNSLREVMEVIVLDYLTSLSSEQDDLETPWMWKGVDPIASVEVRHQLMSGIVIAVLSKVTAHVSSSAQLVEIVAKMALMLFSQLRQTRHEPRGLESCPHQHIRYLDLLFRAICRSATATGNVSAARNARALLYVCVIHVLHVSPSRLLEASAASKVGFISAGQHVHQLLTHQVVELICQDASDGQDTLSMALAVSVLESLVAFENDLSLVARFRERGTLLHLIEIFKKLSELDAVTIEPTPGTPSSMLQSHVLPPGIDSQTIGTMYECFLSLFTRFAETQEGAVTLLESGLIRVLEGAKNLPSHRPQYLAPPEQSSSVSMASFQRVEALYNRKWLPVARFLSACCASLPQNRALTSQVLSFVHKHRKLVTSALKLCSNGLSSSSSIMLTMNLLRELSYVTFLLRSVAPCPDLCDETFAAAKWEKLSQLVLQTFLYFSTDLVPPLDDKNDRTGSSWWHQCTAMSMEEERHADTQRFSSCLECHGKVMDHAEAASFKSSGTVNLFDMSVLEEEQLYASRMILCNAVAFCRKRMMIGVTDANAARAVPLLSMSHNNSAPRQPPFPSMSMTNSREFLAATDPLWTMAPSIHDFTARFDAVVTALETSKHLVNALATCKHDSESARSRRRKEQCETAELEQVVEYHVDSLTFIAENMLVLLFLHFVHYLEQRDTSTASVLEHPFGKVLGIISDMEKTSSLNHAIARKLREVAANIK